MARPFTRRQALENVRFIEVLAQTGNARLAARAVGRGHATMFGRRAGNAAFAQRWEGAAAAAHARFHLAGGKRGPEAGLEPGERCKSPAAPPPRSARSPSPSKPGEELRTEGGEPVVVRTRSGRLQLRPAHAGKLTKTAEQAFLRALAATANVRLSAAAAGASARAFYRRRERDPAFAREMRIALKIGYERLEAALLAAGIPESHADDEWRNCEPLPIPPMTVNQALQLLHLHEKSVHQSWEKPHRRRRRGESDATHRERLAAMWTAERSREAEEAAVARALRDRWRLALRGRTAGARAAAAAPRHRLEPGRARHDSARSGPGAVRRVADRRNAAEAEDKTSDCDTIAGNATKARQAC